ncbi:MAG TPA: hypothetical protein VFO69_11095 [Allosphingosinicella sp.]|nr:hypothetical protein [Allosphingosinicella sp.]
MIGIVAVAAGGTASASPGSGVSAETFATSRLLEDINVNNDRIKFETKDPTTVRVQRLTFAPGARTGWHHHPGLVVVAVESGSVTLTETDCQTTRTYGPSSPNGAVFVEGSDHAHEASSPGGATVLVTYVTPGAGATPVFRVEDPVPSCAI